jgi:prepilin-type N-terminal cleavage/methylation domain-containing protein
MKKMKNKAFTLIETLIGITLITVVLTAVTGLILSTLLSNQRNLHILQATALAQEGVEVMRHVRDSNWLQNYSWNGGTGEWFGDFALSEEDVDDVVTLYLKQEGCQHHWCFSAIDDDGEVDEFLRTITVSHVLDEMDVVMSGMVEVTATVNWDEKGVDREVVLSTYLTDWQ